jgi:hypothetical protein
MMLRTTSLLLVIVLSIGASRLAIAEGQSDTSTELFKERAIEILTQQDSLAAIEYIAEIRQPALVVQVFIATAHTLYWDRKSVSAAIAMGRAGIQYALIEAIRNEDRNASERFRSVAKGLAYDLSAYAWPGWNEPGVEIMQNDLIHGQDLAKVNLRLARSLRKGDVALSRAHWLVGAHYLPVSEYEAARRSFVDAAKFATAAGDRSLETLNRGYIYLAEYLMDPNNEALVKEFDFILTTLAEGGEEGASYRDQLQKAWQVFVKQAENQQLSQNP